MTRFLVGLGSFTALIPSSHGERKKENFVTNVFIFSLYNQEPLVRDWGRYRCAQLVGCTFSYQDDLFVLYFLFFHLFILTISLLQHYGYKMTLTGSPWCISKLNMLISYEKKSRGVTTHNKTTKTNVVAWLNRANITSSLHLESPTCKIWLLQALLIREVDMVAALKSLQHGISPPRVSPHMLVWINARNVSRWSEWRPCCNTLDWRSEFVPEVLLTTIYVINLSPSTIDDNR